MSPIRKVLEVLPGGFDVRCRPDEYTIDFRLAEDVDGQFMCAYASVDVLDLDGLSPDALRKCVEDVCEALRVDMAMAKSGKSKWDGLP